MAGLQHSERLQPSLLDRLTDDAPSNTSEAKEQRVLSLRQLKQGVLRDLSWLLNTSPLESMVDLTDFPFVSHSVLNYGAPVLSGTHLSSLDVPKIEKKLRQAIMDFEPRILPDTINLKLIMDEGQMSHRSLCFKIEGELWAQPQPIQLYIRSEMDLETGEVTVKDFGA